MNTLAPPSLTSIRPGARMITPPRIFSSQAAVASGSGLRKWIWSQVTIGGIHILPWLVACHDGIGLASDQFSRRAAARPSLAGTGNSLGAPFMWRPDAT